MWNDLILYAVVPALTLFYWRGTWEICNIYIYPGEYVKTAWASLTIGYVGLALYFSLQYVSCRYHVNNPRESDHSLDTVIFMFSRLESYFVGFFVVNCWRGLWYLQDIYLVPTYPVLSAWLSHSVGVVFLICLRKFKSVYAPPAIDMDDGADARMNLLDYHHDAAKTTQGNISLKSIGALWSSGPEPKTPCEDIAGEADRVAKEDTMACSQEEKYSLC